MRTHELPGLRALLSYVLLVSGFLLYGQATFYRDPGSLFFDESRAFERQYSSYREREVRDYINDLDSTISTKSLRAGLNPSVCASFLSVKRNGEQPLPLAVASGIQGLSSCERKDLYFNVLLAHSNTSTHPSSRIPWLSDIVDNIHGYDVPLEQSIELERLEEQKDFSTKAVYDYIYAMEKCYDTNASWIVIFEDDIILADGWFVQTLQAVTDIQHHIASSNSDWLFLRLFNQERSIGWASSIPGENHEALISLLVAVPLLSALLFVRSRYLQFRRQLDNATLAIICFLAIPTFVVLFFQAGKASMLPPLPGVHKEPFGCCSQALVFPRDQFPRVRDYFSRKHRGQIDLMLDELAVRDSLDRYALYPVQVQHIGQNSVRGTEAREAQAIWSMAFEQQSPQVLSSAHKKMRIALYGDKCYTN
ncbi:hypothetical protein LTR84_008640 [Exophiala bonariae]|uniref:Integral membrane protein n=1 Tax=Exophiala bonariae TaxID=1690606 RepID=A0AAV9N047_9EURO|nr:hypothetical protein LTR84_008640 [Exophiala bonariae]